MSASLQTLSHQTVTMEIEGIEEVQKILDTLAEDMRGPALLDMVTNAGEMTRDWMKENVRMQLWRNPTGALESSIFATVMTNDEGMTAYVGPNMNLPYAMIHEYGGDIYPKKAKLLHWVGSDGKDYFSKHVYIPARPYIAPALNDPAHQEELLEMMNSVLDEYIAMEIEGSGAL